MNISQNFTLYCKGKQEDIDRFKARVAEVFIFRFGDLYINRDDSSLIFARDDRPDMCVYADFLPLMAEFTEEIGVPLSFFFAVNRIKRNDTDVCCGYAVFQGGNLEHAFSSQWTLYEDFEKKFDANDEENSGYTVKKAFDKELAGVYDNWVKPVYTMWLDDFSSVSCLREVQRNPEFLGSIPEDFITPEICLVAVKKNGIALFFVPKKLKTPELCRIAVENNGYALKYVPKKLKTPGLYLAAVQDRGTALKYVPEAQKIPELCFVAIKKDGYALKYVPENLKTPELCLAAAQGSGWALKYVPEALKTPELCLAAVQDSGQALEYVPDILKTPELCITAIQGCFGYSVLKFVPKALRKPVKQKLGI
jgi:hypothetical protein